MGFAGKNFLISQFEQIAMQNAVHGTYNITRKTELKNVHEQISGQILLNKCQNKSKSIFVLRDGNGFYAITRLHICEI